MHQNRSLTVYQLIAIAALVTLYPAYLFYSDGLLDPTGVSLIGRDFINYYNASVYARAGELETLFQADLYNESLLSQYHAYLALNWSYPPSFIVFLLPLSFVPYLWAYGLWSAAGFIVFAMSTLRDKALCVGNRRASLLFMLLSPAVLMNLFFGQNGFITGALLYLGVRWMDRRPWISGLCFGLLTIKPQLGLLIPIALLLRRCWITILSATLTSLVLVLLSALILGVEIWPQFFEHVVPYQGQVMEFGTGLMQRMMPTAYNAGRFFGLPADISLLLQIPFSIFAIGVTIWVFRKSRRDDAAETLLFLICVFLVSPYMFSYDLVALVPAILAYGHTRKPLGGKLSQTHHAIISLLYLVPLFVFFAPVGAPLLAICALLLLQERQKETASPPADAKLAKQA